MLTLTTAVVWRCSPPESGPNDLGMGGTAVFDRPVVYRWNPEDSVAADLESDLRKTIPSAHELTDPPRIERFSIVDVLRR